MKILDVTEFFSERGGGVRAYLTQLLREGTNRGHEVVVVAPGPRNEESALHGGRLVRLAGPALPYDPSYHALWNVAAVRDVVRRERPDVLQASSPYVAALVGATERSVAVRALVLHSDQIGSYAHPVLSRALGPKMADRVLAPAWAGLRALAGRFDHTIVSARWFADRLRSERFPRVSQAPFGIDRGSLGPALRDEALRAAYLGAAAGDARARVVLIVGRLALEKRLAFVLDALADVARRRPLAVVVLGDGPERPRLERKAASLALPVHFEGFVTDRARYARTLASADALVHGCAVETFGFAVAEALASGLPAVVPASGGAGELVDDSCGAAYPPDASVAAAAVTIDRLLDLPPGPLREGAVARAARIPGAASHFDTLFSIYGGRR